MQGQWGPGPESLELPLVPAFNAIVYSVSWRATQPNARQPSGRRQKRGRSQLLFVIKWIFLAPFPELRLPCVLQTLIPFSTIIFRLSVCGGEGRHDRKR